MGEGEGDDRDVRERNRDGKMRKRKIERGTIAGERERKIGRETGVGERDTGEKERERLGRKRGRE